MIELLLFIAALSWDLITDYRKWLLHKTLNHTKEAWLRALVLSPCIGLMMFHLQLPIVNLWLNIGIGFLLSVATVGFCWWFLFDAIYNRLRGFKIFFNGSRDAIGQDSKLDLFLMNIPDWLEACIKIIPAVILLFLFIKFHQNSLW